MVLTGSQKESITDVLVMLCELRCIDEVVLAATLSDGGRLFLDRRIVPRLSLPPPLRMTFDPVVCRGGRAWERGSLYRPPTQCQTVGVWLWMATDLGIYPPFGRLSVLRWNRARCYPNFPSRSQSSVCVCVFAVPIQKMFGKQHWCLQNVVDG